MPTINYQWHEVPGPVAPDVPYHVNQSLAGIDGTMRSVDDRVQNLEIQAGTAPGGINDAQMTTVLANTESSYRGALDELLAAQAADYEQQLDAVRNQAAADVAAVAALLPKFSPWYDLTSWLRNGWKASTGTEAPQYRKITYAGGIEEVVLRGQIVAPDSISGNSIAFYLNTDYRPTGGTLYFALGASTSVDMNARIGGGDGAATFWSASSSGALRPLNNIRFFRD